MNTHRTALAFGMAVSCCSFHVSVSRRRRQAADKWLIAVGLRPWVEMIAECSPPHPRRGRCEPIVSRSREVSGATSFDRFADV